MNNNRKRTALCLLGATLCVFMAFGAALYFGRYPITLQALLAGDAMAVRTFTVLRLPRAVMALAGGFGLGVAGFVYQTVFRNPLASPDIIGVSSGASVGAAFAILFVSSGTLGTTVCAFAGGLAAVFLSLGLAAAAPGRSKMNLVLAGIAVHALAQTLLMLLKLTADPEKELASIEYWIMGSLAGVTQSRVWFPIPMIFSCCAVIFALHRQAMLLSIEEDEARLLGVPVGQMRFLLLTLATLVVATVVSVTGLSMGGCLTLMIAEQSDPTAIAPISAPMGVLNRWFPLARFAAPFLPEISWQARKDDALTPDYDLGYTGFPTKSAVDLRRIIHEARDNLCAVTCPVLCVQSSGDQVITPDSADVILQGVRSKTKGVLRLKNVPHVCTISREGAHIAQALGTFFRKAEESERT